MVAQSLPVGAISHSGQHQFHLAAQIRDIFHPTGNVRIFSGALAIEVIAAAKLRKFLQILLCQLRLCRISRLEILLNQFLHIRLLIHGQHINRGLHDIHIEIAEGLHAATDILPQFILKLALIGTFQDDLAQFHQKNLVHNCSY